MERTLSPSPTPTRTADIYKPANMLCLLATLLMWQRRIRTRRQLACLDERMLADAGISTAQRQAELDKPFWR